MSAPARTQPNAPRRNPPRHSFLPSDIASAQFRSVGALAVLPAPAPRILASRRCSSPAPRGNFARRPPAPHEIDENGLRGGDTSAHVRSIFARIRALISTLSNSLPEFSPVRRAHPAHFHIVGALRALAARVTRPENLSCPPRRRSRANFAEQLLVIDGPNRVGRRTGGISALVPNMLAPAPTQLDPIKGNHPNDPCSSC